MTAAADRGRLRAWLDHPIESDVGDFVEGPGISRLLMTVDIARLRATCADIVADLGKIDDVTGHAADGFGVISLTRRPGVERQTATDQSGRYWMQTSVLGNDEPGSFGEEAFEPIVDESAYSELVPQAQGTYIDEVHQALSERFVVGRMRLLSKASYNCNSWHRDPEPRIHIPVISNPGSLFIVNQHCTPLPADGSVYFTDTRGYHTALNGGLDERTHVVAAIAGTK